MSSKSRVVSQEKNFQVGQSARSKRPFPSVVSADSSPFPVPFPSFLPLMVGRNAAVAGPPVPFEKEFPAQFHFFTVPSVAEVLGVSKQHVYNLIDTGEIELGADIRTSKSRRSCIRIPRSSLVRFLQSRHTTTHLMKSASIPEPS